MIKQKGPPIFSDEERKILLLGCRWVDEVIMMPYGNKLETMERHNCDYIIHGKEPTILLDGRDSYAETKKANKYISTERTYGVSTTSILDRIIQLINIYKIGNYTNTNNSNLNKNNQISFSLQRNSRSVNALRIAEFCNKKRPTKNDTILYVPGKWDLFHCGHVLFLQIARKIADYIIVGVYSDQTIQQMKGKGFPLMNVYERSLSVLACRYVDDVIIDAPYIITNDFLKDLRINKVAYGLRKVDKKTFHSCPYTIPKQLGILTKLNSPLPHFCVNTIILRIVKNWEIYSKRQEQKNNNLRNK
ncbi:ethanolamine-phosphate cytidylyltransferase [Anaeramoeba flamelloides]|uniref:ethanolamine-phosphate cytidylyltransferase n=1 Tax=Anaeramoeba flamelloides TaxID=1746091 RepID=A0ABQ8Z855_9EUKA|nr:ethanolamine-phosphate cytidylyltransferase [Anaeramoeba flamelloides]